MNHIINVDLSINSKDAFSILCKTLDVELVDDPLNKQETARVNAETKRIEAEVNAETKRINAQAEADANTIINNSLTENVIRQNYIDALRDIGKKGNLVVVPDGSSPMIKVGE